MLRTLRVLSPPSELPCTGVWWEKICATGLVSRKKSSLSQEQQDRLATGPGLFEFVSSQSPITPEHLVRKKGQR